MEVVHWRLINKSTTYRIDAQIHLDIETLFTRLLIETRLGGNPWPLPNERVNSDQLPSPSIATFLPLTSQ